MSVKHFIRQHSQLVLYALWDLRQKKLVQDDKLSAWPHDSLARTMGLNGVVSRQTATSGVSDQVGP